MMPLLTMQFSANQPLWLAAGVIFIVIVLSIVFLVSFSLRKFLRRDIGAARSEFDPATPKSPDDPAFLSASMQGVIHRLKAQEKELERLHHEEKQRALKTERLSEAVTRNMPTGLLLINSTGLITLANPAAQAALGMATLSYRRYDEALGVDSRVSRLLAECLRDARTFQREEVEHVTPAGELRQLGVTISPVLAPPPHLRGPAVDSPPGKIAGALCLLSDLTELTALQKQVRLKESLALLGELSAGIAHEFKSALATISGYAQILQSEAAPGEQAECSEKIVQETRALTHLVTEFLRFARPLEFTPTTVDLRALVDRTVAELREEMPRVSFSAEGEFGLVPGDDGLLRQALAGTGPFLLKASGQSERHTLVRNPDYFQQGLPYFDGVEVQVIPDRAIRFNAFRAGKIHDPGPLMTEENKEIIDREQPDLAMARVPGHTTAAFIFNHARRPFDDARVRRAMYLAFDRQALIDANRSGRAQLVRWVATPAKGAYATPEDDLKQMPGFRQPKDEDLAEAQELLAAAGVPQGFETSMTVARGGVQRANAEVFAEQMSQGLGIQIRLRAMDAPKHREAVQVGNFSLSADLLGASIDPGRALASLSSRHVENNSRYKSPAFDELFDRQARTLDVQERRRLLFQLYDLLDHDVPIIPSYADYNYRGFPRQCHGIPEDPRYNALVRYLAEAWCEPGVLE